MPRPRRETCIICDRHVDECGPLSATYRCFDCGSAKAAAQQRGMHNHENEHMRHWRRQTILAAGGILPPDLLEDERD